MLRSNRNSHRDFLRSQSIVRRRRKRTILSVLSRILLLLILLSGILYVARLDRLAIKKVIVVGSDSETMERVQGVSEQSLKGLYLGLIPKNNALFYPKQLIYSEILLKEPRIKELTLKTEGFGILNVKLKERLPAMKWCNGSSCFNIDDQSFVYGTATDEVLISISGGILGTSTSPMQQNAFEPELFKTIKQTVATLSSSSLAVARVAVRSPDQIEYGILGNGYVVFSGRRPVEESMGNLDAALKSSRFSIATQFEYIDTRFGNKVFIKPRDTGTTTASSTGKH